MAITNKTPPPSPSTTTTFMTLSKAMATAAAAAAADTNKHRRQHRRRQTGGSFSMIHELAQKQKQLQQSATVQQRNIPHPLDVFHHKHHDRNQKLITTAVFSEDWSGDTLGSWSPVPQDVTDGQNTVYPPVIEHGSLRLDARIHCQESSNGGGGLMGTGVVHSLDSSIITVAGWYTVQADVRHVISRVDSCNHNNNNVDVPPPQIESSISIRGVPVASFSTTLTNNCAVMDFESTTLSSSSAWNIELIHPGDSEEASMTIALKTNVAFLECGEIITYWDNITIFSSPLKTRALNNEPASPTSSPSPFTAAPTTPLFMGFREDWNNPNVLSSWVVTTSGMDSWDFEPYPFIDEYDGIRALELDAISWCESDGYEVSLTRTLPVLPAGRYDLQAHLDHTMQVASGLCREDWSVIHIRVNNKVVARHGMPCSLNGQSQELTLTASLIRIQGDGTDTLTLSVSNGGCIAGGGYWRDIMLTPSTATVPPGPTSAPTATPTLAPTPVPVIPVFWAPWPTIPQGTIEGWVVETIRYRRGDDKYTYPFVQDDGLVVQVSTDCLVGSADAGLGIMIIGTIQGVPPGQYDVQVKMSHITYPWWDQDGVGGVESGFSVNGQVLDTDTLIGMNGIKMSNALTMSARKVDLRGDGTDTITLFSDIDKCTDAFAFWDDIALIPTDTNASPAPTPAPLKNPIFLEDWSSDTLSSWTMSLSRFDYWWNEYKDPYVDKGELIMYLGTRCENSAEDGESMGFTRTLVGIPAGLYDVQARIDYVMYIFYKCEAGGGEISLFINGKSVVSAFLDLDGQCGENDRTRTDLSASNVQIKGDGRDKLMLYVDIKECTVLTTYWDNIALALVSSTGSGPISNTSATTPAPTESFSPSAISVSIRDLTQTPTAAPLHRPTRNPALSPSSAPTWSTTSAPSLPQPQLPISSINTDAPSTSPSDALMGRGELAVPSVQPTPVAFDKTTLAPFLVLTETDIESGESRFPSDIPSAIPSQEPSLSSIPTPKDDKVWGTEIEGLNKVDTAKQPKVPAIVEGSVDEVWVFEVTLQLLFVSRLARQLNQMDIMGFEQIVSESCLEYYASRKDDDKDNGNNAANVAGGGQQPGRNRYLQNRRQRRRDARDVIKADIKFLRQELSYDDNNEMPVNIITYDQHFVFVPYTQSVSTTADGTRTEADDDGNEEEDANLYTPMELAKLPFNETAWNMRLGNELQEKVPALKDVKLPLEVPVVPNQAQFLISGKDDGIRNKLSEGAVAGIFIAMAAIFAVVVAYGLRRVEIDLQPAKKIMRKK